ncbi:MAG TPA: GNAT family N-acetyltransferase [Mycobacteriales bacterium]|nr:GNAT family N-acetyltransferase [Mycobacteriales bacterium]
MDALVLAHHDAETARRASGDLAALHRLAYLGTPQEHDPFYSDGRFAERLERYLSAPGFELVTAHADRELVGYLFGYVLPPAARWWDGLLDAVPDGFTDETGQRTFAVNELHVRAGWRGHGVASRLHAELIGHREEARATILVRPENAARAMYLHWGYRRVGRLRPFADAPVYDALVLPLGDRGSR